MKLYKNNKNGLLNLSDEAGKTVVFSANEEKVLDSFFNKHVGRYLIDLGDCDKYGNLKSKKVEKTEKRAYKKRAVEMKLDQVRKVEEVEVEAPEVEPLGKVEESKEEVKSKGQFGFKRK